MRAALLTVKSNGVESKQLLRVNEAKVDEDRKLLIERVAASRYISRSARLRDLLLYLTECAAEGSSEIHEQDIGHRVFGRDPDYDTASDNIVRVHASTLRKRLEQYFSGEGAHERWIVEIPRGNYVPVFRERAETDAASALAPPEHVATKHRDWRLILVAGLAAAFALATAYMAYERFANERPPIDQRGPTVRAFWSQLFSGPDNTNIVLDDAAVGLYQELGGRNLSLSEYFDRSYQRTLSQGAAATKLDETTASAIIVHRYSSASSAQFVWKLSALAGPLATRGVVLLARDFSVHALKSGNTILLANTRSNPWMEPFLPRLGLRWNFDKASGTFYPVDTWAAGEPKSFRGNSESGDNHEGYCSISLVPNLGGNGNVLLVSATGGSAFNAAAAFLGDEAALQQLRKMLPEKKDNLFPYFEALIRVKGRSSLPRDATVVICRLGRET